MRALLESNVTYAITHEFPAFPGLAVLLAEAIDTNRGRKLLH